METYGHDTVLIPVTKWSLLNQEPDLKSAKMRHRGLISVYCTNEMLIKYIKYNQFLSMAR